MSREFSGVHPTPLSSGTGGTAVGQLRGGGESLRGLCNRIQARVLIWLERMALTPGPIQRFMLRSHERAFVALLPNLPVAHGDLRVAVIGGGLFPRTALLLLRLLPRCRLTLIDESQHHLTLARDRLPAGAAVDLVAERYDPLRHREFDLLVAPLGYVGDRQTLYRPVGAVRAVIVHDWIWRRRGQAGVRVSWLLLKRLNLALSDER